MEELPYKQGSKSYLIAKAIMDKGIPQETNAEKLLIAEIAKDFAVKEKTVRNVKSILKKKGLIDTSYKPKPSTPPSLPPPPPPPQPVSPNPENPSSINMSREDPREGAVNFPELNGFPRIPRGNQRMVGGSPEEATVEVEGFPVGKKVRLSPKNLTMMDWFISKYNYQGDYSDFINDAIEDFFQARGYRLKVVKEEEVA